MATKKGPVNDAGKAGAYSKQQLLSSQLYAGRIDALNVILADNKLYSVAEVDKKLEQFMKGKVK